MKYYFYLTKNKKKLYILLTDGVIVLGFIYLNKISNDTWEIPSIVAEKGYGYKMHDAAMDLIYPEYIIPSRNTQIKEPLFKTYINYINRTDIKNVEIYENDPIFIKTDKFDGDWFNRKYKLKEPISIDFEMSDVNIKYKGIKYFISKYDFKKNESV